MGLSFQVTAQDPLTRGRCGLIRMPRGEVETPVFMPVGTGAAVKAIPHEFLEQLPASLILGNTYHLYLRPGAEVIGAAGGLHRFMAWKRLILTDSGGYQVFSHQALRRISEEGVRFQSHLDGSSHFFTPEFSIEFQELLGADIIMAFDECTPYPVSWAEARESMRRSMRWAERSRRAHRNQSQALFGIVQGGMFPDLRQESLDLLMQMDFPGLAVGGLSVGEPRMLMYEMISEIGPRMPEGKPRYLMGVGTPLDLLHAVEQGMDMFDCVLPTRNARNGTLFTWKGKIRIKNAAHAQDLEPLDAGCDCLVCRRYSRAYLRHLFVSGEILSSILNTYHNLYFYAELMQEIRRSIRQNSWEQLKKRLQDSYIEEN